jgi:hypothetical protein
MASNRPHAHEIVACVRKFLAQEPAASNEAALYQRRIASNLLGILERELIHGPDAWRRERARLSRWLDKDAGDDAQACNHHLCQRIRSGELDGDAELFEHLCQTVSDKLAVDNPRYSTWVHWQALHKATG